MEPESPPRKQSKISLEVLAEVQELNLSRHERKFLNGLIRDETSQKQSRIEKILTLNGLSEDQCLTKTLAPLCSSKRYYPRVRRRQTTKNKTYSQGTVPKAGFDKARVSYGPFDSAHGALCASLQYRFVTDKAFRRLIMEYRPEKVVKMLHKRSLQKEDISKSIARLEAAKQKLLQHISKGQQIDLVRDMKSTNSDIEPKYSASQKQRFIKQAAVVLEYCYLRIDDLKRGNN